MMAWAWLLVCLLPAPASSSLPPECLEPGSSLTPVTPGDKTLVTLGYLTAVSGSMNNRQVLLRSLKIHMYIDVHVS